MAQLANVNVKRIIDLSSSVAISKTTVTIKNTGSEAVSYFLLPIHQSEVTEITDLWIVDQKSPKAALKTEVASSVAELDPEHEALKVYFSKPLAADAKITLDIRIDIANVIKPIPAEIEKYETQYMRYTGNAYFFSAYPTASMQTTLVLGSATVTSKNLKDPFKRDLSDPKRYILGPYSDVTPHSYEKIDIRFKNDKGFLVANQFEKQFYVSHWGSIATKEEYKVINAGARHVGEWSRIDYAGYVSKYPTAIGEVWANLPADANRVVYKDLLGNVTSSRLRKATKSKRAVHLTFRFPLMGGWRNHFWYTYDLNLNTYLTSKTSGSEYFLELPLFPSVNLDLFCKEHIVRVLLPEGATSYEVLDHPSLSFDVQKTLERTTLTLYGRPVLTLKLKGVRSFSKHKPKFTIRYRYNQGLVWITPLVIACAIFAVFATFIMCVRNGLSMAEQEENEISEKLKSS